MVGKTISEWDTVGENGTGNLKYSAIFDNIVISDGGRNVKKVVFKNSSDSNANADGSWNANSNGSISVSGNGSLAIPNARIQSTVFPSNDIVIADFVATDAVYGADSTGVNDSTKAINDAIFDCYLNGGGTVWLPAGKYKISSTVYVMPFVTLRGDWRDPDISGANYGTVILANVASSTQKYPGLFRIGGSAAVKGLTVYYPNQNATNPIPYPYTFEIPGRAWNGDFNFQYSAIVDCTLLNSYNGICMSITPNNFGESASAGQLHEIATVKNVKGTILNTGFEAYGSSDVSCWEKIKLSNSYWANAGTDNSGYNFNPNSYSKADIDSWTRANGTGFILGDLEWDQFAEIQAEQYNTGFRFVTGLRDGVYFNGSFFNVNIHDCNTAIKVEANNWRWGNLFTRCSLQGSNFCICNMDPDGSWGYMKFVDCTLTGTNYGPKIIVSNPGTSPVSYPWKSILPKPANNTLYVVNADKTGGTDSTAAIQAQLNNAGNAGGGTVYLPAGYYKISTHLSVPANVELRGVMSLRFRDNPGISIGTYLLGYEGIGTSNPETDTAMITLNGNNAGISGVSIFYPGNNPQKNNWVSYTCPYMIRGNGTGVYVKNVNLVNPLNGIDFKTYRCDNHYISGVTGLAYNKFIVIGASNEGWIENCLVNPSNTSRTNLNQLFGWHAQNGHTSWQTCLMTRNFGVMFKIDGAANEHMIDNFGYGLNILASIKSGMVTSINSGSDGLAQDGFGYKVDSGCAIVVNQLRWNGLPYKGNVIQYNEGHLLGL